MLNYFSPRQPVITHSYHVLRPAMCQDSSGQLDMWLTVPVTQSRRSFVWYFSSCFLVAKNRRQAVTNWLWMSNTGLRPDDTIVRFESYNTYSLNSSPPSAAYMRRWTGSTLVQTMACRLVGTKPLSEQMPVYCQLEPWKQISVKFESELLPFSFKRIHLNMSFATMADNLSRGRGVKKKAPDSKIHWDTMGPTWVLSAPDGLHAAPMNLVIREYVIRPE